MGLIGVGRGYLRAVAGIAVWLAVTFGALAADPAGAAQDPPATASPRIIGGGPTAQGERGFQVYVRAGGGLLFGQCGGAVIAKRKVVTAAHCVDSQQPSQVTVYAGSTKARQGTAYPAQSIAVHPGWGGGNSRSFANDVAVITLASDVAAPTVALAGAADAADYAPGVMATVSGWGRTSNGGSVSEDLLKVDVPIIADAVCGSPNAYGSTLVPDVMLCAGAANRDSCEGDSGGPLTVISAAVPKLVGIVSFASIQGCGSEDRPGVYTEVPGAPIRGFIESVAGAPPTVDIGDSRKVAGLKGTLTSQAVDPTPGGSVAVSWDLDNDGVFDDAQGPNVDWVPPAPGPYTVRALAVDGDGMQTASARTFNVVVARPRLAEVRLETRRRRGRLTVRGTLEDVACGSAKARVTVTRRGERRRVVKRRGGRRVSKRRGTREVARRTATTFSSCRFSAIFNRRALKQRGRYVVRVSALTKDGERRVGTRSFRMR